MNFRCFVLLPSLAGVSYERYLVIVSLLEYFWVFKIKGGVGRMQIQGVYAKLFMLFLVEQEIKIFDSKFIISLQYH